MVKYFRTGNPESDATAYCDAMELESQRSEREYDIQYNLWQERCQDLREFGFYMKGCYDPGRVTIMDILDDGCPEFITEWIDANFWPCLVSQEYQADEYRRLRDAMLNKCYELLKEEMLK